ncbi:CHAT domain-containing protein [Promicromonospora sp. Marseille-Q5078]
MTEGPSGRLARAREVYARAQSADELGRFAAALEEYERLGREVGADAAVLGGVDDEAVQLRARALLGQARCLYETRGNLGQALAVLDEAEAWCREAHLAVETVAVHGQRGLLLLRAGETEQALGELDAAEPVLVQGRSRDAAVLLLNRGALRLEVGDVSRAITDLAASIEHARSVGARALEGKAQHNLGYAEFLRGDLPRALRLMDLASELEDDPDDAVGKLDRARVLYEAGLVSEAARMLEDAADVVAVHGAEVDLAYIRWAGARCMVLLERFDHAADLARQARDAFLSQSNDAWAARAELVELEALLAETEMTGDGALDVVQERARSVSQRWRQPPVAVPARILEAEAAIRRGKPDVARAALVEVRRSTRSQPLSVRLQFEAAVAHLAFEAGDRRQGLAAVRRGLDQLSAHRAQLGSLDVVTAAALHGVRLAVVDVLAALRTGHAAPFFDAVERGRATFAGAGRVTPPRDEETASLLSGARRALEASESEDSPTGREAKVQAARRLQEAARRRSWRVSGGEVQAPRAATARAVRAAMRDESSSSSTTLVSYAVVQGEMYATRIAAGRQQLVALGGWAEIAERINRVRADIAVLANAMIPEPMRAVARGSVTRALGWLDDRLVRPLHVTGPLHVVGRHLMLSVPWSALPSRRGLATWVNSWVDLRTGQEPRRAERVLVVVGPDLESSADEATLVAGAWGEARVLDGDRATCAATVEEVQRADVVHLAAHGTHEPDNPLFSSLRLVDGPLFAHELDGVRLSGSTIVLSACEVGRSTSRIGGEPMGLTSVLLRLGATAVVASVGPLRDDVAARVTPALHGGIGRGLPAAEALALAVADEPEPVPLVCFGPLVL